MHYVIHKLVADKLVLDQELGKIRTTPVNIGGTKWKPQFPIESEIKEELEELLNQPEKTKTEIAIEIMLSVMRRQMFIDGNKRVAMLFANKIMIDNGCGIITIAQDDQKVFYDKLIKYYENGDMSDASGVVKYKSPMSYMMIKKPEKCHFKKVLLFCIIKG